MFLVNRSMVDPSDFFPSIEAFALVDSLSIKASGFSEAKACGAATTRARQEGVDMLCICS